MKQTADDYAIDFLNWYISKSSIMDKKYIGKTSKELLEIFKKRIMKQTPIQRIKRVINFYYKRGCNKESVNELYKKILKNGK
jgi:transcription initiation factor TFIIIB Brf1 subunit/transcription initiation factor TFIIB